MKVKLAKSSGFCMGVRRAMEMVLSEVNKNQGDIFTYGPLIHNRQVMELLSSKGICTVDDFTKLEKGTLVIRAHGIPPDQRKSLRASGLRFLDATCPRVARVQAVIRFHTNKGYTPIIVGEKDHPEVVGLVGYGRGQAIVIKNVSDVSGLPDSGKFMIVAQTTQDEQNYRQVVDAVKRRFSNTLVFDTICDATQSRQQEVRSFAGHVDGVVVVGGLHSGNTRRLVQVSEAVGLPTFHVETEKELDKSKLSSMEVVGVTAGASTPNWMIKNVVREIEGIRSHKESLLTRWTWRSFKNLILSNIFASLGAFSLSFAITVLMGRTPNITHPTLALLYVYAMRVLNRFLDRGASTYNDPELATFYRRHRVWMILSAIASILGALLISFTIGPVVFVAIAGLIMIGMIYSIPLVPTSRRHLLPYSKIKDVPGSKTLSEALGWGAIIALIPLLESVSNDWIAGVFSFLYVISVVYVRSGLFDIFQLQGDLIVGVETLPLILGEKRTLRLLKAIVLTTILFLLTAPFFSLVSRFAFMLPLFSVSLFFTLLTYERRWLYTGTYLEALVEGNFFFAGLLALIWHLWS